MDTLLIINPYSRNGKSGALAHKAMSYLKQRKFHFDYVEIKNFDDAYRYSVDANKSAIKNIIAVGGDGTINKVLNGFYNDEGRKISESRFGVIHTGTSPDFCKSYNIPTEYLKAADVIINQKIKNIPVGMIKLKAAPQNEEESLYDFYETKYFACCANIGLGASLARSAGSGIRAYLGDFMGTFLSFIKILATFSGTDYKVIINNKNSDLQNIINISVGITPYIASGLKVYKNEAMRDNQFYILKTSQVHLTYIPKLIKILYSGKEFISSPEISLEYADRIEILNNSVHPEVEFDGDPAGYLPCGIQIANDRLPVFTN